MAGGVNFNGTAKPKKVKPKQGPEMPMMEKIRKAAAPMRGNYSAVGKGGPATTGKTGGAHPPGGLTRKTVPLTKNLSTSIPNPTRATKDLTGSDRPTVVPKNTQVATKKGPASGKMSYMPEKSIQVQKRGAVTSSHKPMMDQRTMDARMNNQRTIRGKLRDSSR